MPLAVTHVLLTIILIDLFRDYIVKNKKLISLHYVFLGGVAGLAPDIDIPLYWFISIFAKISWFHGKYTHLFIIPIVIALASIIMHKYNKKAGILLGIIAFGYGFHIILDYLFYGLNMSPFWPIMRSSFHGLSSIIDIPKLEMGLDAFILLGWLWHEEKRHKISDFI